MNPQAKGITKPAPFSSLSFNSKALTNQELDDLYCLWSKLTQIFIMYMGLAFALYC